MIVLDRYQIWLLVASALLSGVAIGTMLGVLR